MATHARRQILCTGLDRLPQSKFLQRDLVFRERVDPFLDHGDVVCESL